MTVVSEKPFGRRTDTTDNHVCVDGAYKVALSVGKSDKLCASGSSFMRLYQVCKSCIEENSESSKTDINSYIDPKFAQFVEYCEGRPSEDGGLGGESTACDECITTALEDYRGSTVMVVFGTLTVPTLSLLDSKPQGLPRVA